MKSLRPIHGQPIPDGWFAALWDDVRALACRGDGRHIFVKHSADGQLVEFHGDEPGTVDIPPYDGVFRLTKTAEGVDVGAGVALVNGVIFEVAAASLTCSGTGWIFLESIAGASPTVGFSSSKPERSVPPGETASGVFPLGKLTETGIVQLCRSVPHILVLGEECTPCDEDE